MRSSGLSGIGGVARPGIVHRLDKHTSGVMVAAKSDAAHAGLSLVPTIAVEGEPLTVCLWRARRAPAARIAAAS